MTTTDTEFYSDIFDTDTRTKLADISTKYGNQKVPIPEIIKHRVFMNQVDSFHTKRIASVIYHSHIIRDSIAGMVFVVSH